MPCFEKTCTKDRPLQAGSLILIGWVILRVQPPGPNSPISPPSIRPAASQVKQPAGQPAPSQKESSENTAFRQETKVAGLTAEVTFRNGGSRPATFCCQDWHLIGEQTGGQWWPDAYGGRVLCGEVKTLAPGETHVAWVKFKVAAVSDDKYSLNIDSVLNRPFEGLALNPSSEDRDQERVFFRARTPVRPSGCA